MLKHRFKFNIGLALGLTSLIWLPILVLFWSWQHIDVKTWQHLLDTIFFELLSNTFLLIIFVSLGVFVLGVSLAWLVVRYQFPGKALFEWALILPLTIPTYIYAFAFLGVFDYSGPVQMYLRRVLEGEVSWFPSAYGATGAITVFILALYPYVYLLAKLAFKKQAQSCIDSARMLGLSETKIFFKLVLPMARPAIVGGVLLVLMECLADFGAVSILHFNTFTTAIYKVWYGFFDLHTAAQLSTLLLAIVGVILLIDLITKRNKKYTAPYQNKSVEVIHLGRLKTILVITYLSVVILLSFVLPLCRILTWAWQSFDHLDGMSKWGDSAANTLLVAVMSAVVIIAVAWLITHAKRQVHSTWLKLFLQSSVLGYALPGSVIAVGILFAFIDFERSLPNFLGVMLTGTLLGLVLAYLIRYLALAFSTIDSHLGVIKASYYDVAKSLNVSQWYFFKKIKAPLLLPGVLTAMILVSAEVMKELPATLIIRPFGWDTLATDIYQLTSEGLWQQAAIPSLCLIMIGVAVIGLLHKNLH